MKRNHIVALILIAVSVAAITIMVADSSTYETFATAANAEGKQFHIVGTLAEGYDIEYDPTKDANYLSFYIKDNDGTERQVIFLGSKPQDFERSEQIVLTGKMNGDKFLASKILMKCPSKYVEDGKEFIEAT